MTATSATLRNSSFDAFSAAFNAPTASAAMRIAVRKLLNTTNVAGPPIPLAPICKALGIVVRRRAHSAAGTLRLAGSGFEVWVSPSMLGWRRDRFTIAHEIAHVIFLNTLKEVGRIENPHSSEEDHATLEALCDEGAAEMLMPRSYVERHVRESGLSPLSIRTLYDQLLVSYQAMLWQLTRLFPSAAVFLWKRLAARNGQRAELRVFRHFPHYRARAHAPWLPNGCSVRHLSVDVVSAASATKTAHFIENVTIKLGSRIHECIGLAGVIPDRKTAEMELPSFEGMRIPDQLDLRSDAFLLVSPRSMAGRSSMWEDIRRLMA